ncbi:MAG: hypothetical protein J7J44_01030 [Deltaproteobacteria bacterium]|nr:hypothetical protein [Deltaproteobacteria bacterium]
MAVIIKEIRLRGSKGELKREAIFDSRPTYSCIHPLKIHFFNPCHIS